MTDVAPLPAVKAISFDDGDIILRAGNIDFLVHTFMLKQASPFFRTLFSLPQPKIVTPGQDGEPAVLPMDEEPAVLDKILRWVYPIRHKPGVTSIEEARALAAAAEKLDIEVAIDHLNASLSSLLAKEPNPLRAWALAFIFKHDQARLAAAIRFIKITPNTLLPRVIELGSIPALDYADLLHLRQEAHNRAKKALSYEYSSWWGCKACCKEAYNGLHVQGKELQEACPEWYLNYLEKTAGRNPLLEDVASDGLLDSCIANSQCDACKNWYDGLAIKYRPAPAIRVKLGDVHGWIAEKASSMSNNFDASEFNISGLHLT